MSHGVIFLGILALTINSVAEPVAKVLSSLFSDSSQYSSRRSLVSELKISAAHCYFRACYHEMRDAF